MAIQREYDKRQAVIIIHGMGEQRPMGTLRDFLKGTHDEDQQFFSRPYKRGTTTGNQNYDLRRFSTSERSASGDEPARLKTDFYELYWAHFLGTGNRRDTIKWIWENMRRRPFWKHGPQVKLTMMLLQLIAPLALILWLALTVLSGATIIRGMGDLSPGPLMLVNLPWAIVTVGLAFVLIRYGPRLLNTINEVVADPPRYFVPHPRHIRARNEIRDAGICLLHQLHDAGFYERVVVVGHSLGSVVGLDILRLTWDEYRHPDPESTEPDHLARSFDSKVLDYSTAPTTDHVLEFQKIQHALWQESRARGVKWLVTDFITLGSPLAHADWLMFDDDPAVQADSFSQREYPAYPPDIGRGIFYPGEYTSGNKNTLVAHHAALFSVTRWSNAYFPVQGLYGDPVGGDVAPIFGTGVRDVRVRIHSLETHVPSERLGIAHTRYWNRYLDPYWDWENEGEDISDARKELDQRSRTRVAHLALQEFLDLDFQFRVTQKLDPPGCFISGPGYAADTLADAYLPEIPAENIISLDTRSVFEKDTDGDKAVAEVSAPLV